MILVGGVERFSSLDYPGYLSIVVFCQGCSWRCTYCHNKHLWKCYDINNDGDRNGKDDDYADSGKDNGGNKLIPWREVIAFAKKRIGVIDAIVFSGGEPLLQPFLADAMEEVRALGFGVALHSCGMHSNRFARILPLVDWVGFDVKALFDDYELVTCVRDSGDEALRSLKILLESGKSYETRMTIAPGVFSANYVLRVAKFIYELGVKRFALQAYRAPEKNGNNIEMYRMQRAEYYNNIALNNELAKMFEWFEMRGFE